MLAEALKLTEERGDAAIVALARALSARLEDGDVNAALQAMESAGDAGNSSETQWHLWLATSKQSHLATAKRLLDERLAKVPDEYHESMCTNLRLHRRVLAAWQSQGAEE